MPATTPVFVTDERGNPIPRVQPASLGQTTSANSLPVVLASDQSAIPVTIAAAAASIGKAEDTVAATGDVGVATWGVRAPVVPIAPTSAAGDYSAKLVDAEGKTIIAGTADPTQIWRVRTDFTLAASAALKASAGATLRSYLTDLTIENTGAAAVRVSLLDVAAVAWSATIPAGSTLVVPFGTALRPAAINTAWNIQLGAVGTVTVTAGGYAGI